MKILVVEDEQELLDSVCTYLTREGYLCERAADFATANQKIILYSYDCCLIDIGLPDGNGLKLIQKLKQLQPNTGNIIISARHALDDKLKGLDIGADDYLTKPFTAGTQRPGKIGPAPPHAGRLQRDRIQRDPHQPRHVRSLRAGAGPATDQEGI
jgi:DNA-binding NtrC family response regulator